MATPLTGISLEHPPVSVRRPPEMTETIAEALRAGLALVAVVLLARANVGALTRSPSVGVALSVGLLAWGTATWSARWSPWADGSRLRVWKDCVAPALISLVMAGSGGPGSLLLALGLIAIGSLAVGVAAVCCRTNLPQSVPVRLEMLAVEVLEPMAEREGESEPVDRSSGENLPVGECPRPDSPAPDALAVSSPVDLSESIETSIDESHLVESWTRTESDGEVSIEAVIQARLAEGSKLAVVHLPFVPPLPSVPQIECEPLDSGCDVEIQTEAVYRHGARLSVTRPTAGPAKLVPIGVVVYTSAEEPIES